MIRKSIINPDPTPEQLANRPPPPGGSGSKLKPMTNEECLDALEKTIKEQFPGLPITRENGTICLNSGESKMTFKVDDPPRDPRTDAKPREGHTGYPLTPGEWRAMIVTVGAIVLVDALILSALIWYALSHS